MTQDGPEAQTRTDFEEGLRCCEPSQSVKNSDSGYSVFSAETLHRWKMPFSNAVEQNLEVVSRQQAGELTRERSMTMRRFVLQASLALDHKRRWKRALHHAAKHIQGVLHVGQTFLVLATWSACSQETTLALSSATRWPQFGLLTAVQQ